MHKFPYLEFENIRIERHYDLSFDLQIAVIDYDVKETTQLMLTRRL